MQMGNERLGEFKSRFLLFFPDEKEKKRIENDFEQVIARIPRETANSITKYIDLYNQGQTDSEKLYFAQKAAARLKPFFSKE